MLLDFELPAEFITMVPALPSSAYLAIASPVAKASWSPLWACDGRAPPPLFADILQDVAVSDQRGDSTSFDVSLVEASEVLNLLQAVRSAPFSSPPPVKQVTRRSVSKRSEPKSKALMKAPVTSVTLVDAKHLKVNPRAPPLSDHIMRERLRRDDMAAKYFDLESLLPPASKRERAVVVEDATLLVTALQQKKAQLLKRRAHLKSVELAPNQHSPRMKIRSWTSQLGQKSIGCSGACIKQQSATVDENDEHKLLPDPSKLSSSERGALVPQGMTAIANAINVHAGKEDVVVEILWNRPPSNFESSLLHTVENLGLEVTRCSILRATGGFVQCFITCSKPRVPSQLKLEIQSSEFLIMEALRDLLRHSR